MQSMTELIDSIEANAAKPKRIQIDGNSTEQHPLQDQIAADQYVRERRASSRSTLPIRTTKIRPDGTA